MGFESKGPRWSACPHRINWLVDIINTKLVFIFPPISSCFELYVHPYMYPAGAVQTASIKLEFTHCSTQLSLSRSSKVDSFE